MFSTSRIVAIDDELDQLNRLSHVLHAMGIPCIPVHFPNDMPEEGATWFGAVRIAFCDLHLINTSQSEKNFPVVGSLLDKMSAARRGPLLLILWTKYPEEADKLQAYLAERHAASKPVAVVALDKTQFEGAAAEQLPAAVRERLDAIPQLRALLEWEDDVGSAAASCVGELLKLVVAEQGDMREALDLLLSTLAQAAAGKVLAAQNPGAALVEVLMPMLADQLVHLPDDAARIAGWKTALSKAAAQAKCKATPERAAAINTALSVVYPTGAGINGRDRGAVVPLTADLVKLRLGITIDDALKCFDFKAVPAHRWVAIQTEAACDYAQQTPGSLPFTLALEIPAEDKPRSPSPSIWVSPPFKSETGTNVCLAANVRHAATYPASKAVALKAAYRIREPWVNELAFKKTHNESRPGIVALRP